MTKRRTWDRLPDETDAPWYAFLVFRDEVEHPRDLTQVSRLTHDVRPPNGYAYQTLQQWSSQFCWFSRARDFDEHLNAKRTRAAERAAEKQGARLARKQLEAGEGLLDVANAAVKKLRSDAKRGMLSAQQVARVARDGTHITRLVEGESTERVETKLDLSNLSDEELALWETLRNKAAGKP